LDPDASKICTIIFPWGKYSNLGLPMGIAGSPEVFEAKMSELMVALEFRELIWMICYASPRQAWMATLII